MTEREAFEKWATEVGYDLSRQPGATYYYHSTTTNSAWSAWRQQEARTERNEEALRTLGHVRDIVTEYLIPDGIDESKAIHMIIGVLEHPASVEILRNHPCKEVYQ